jgi:hypothetical protein
MQSMAVFAEWNSRVKAKLNIGIVWLVGLCRHLNVNFIGQGALQAASHLGQKKVVKILPNAGADVNTQVGVQHRTTDSITSWSRKSGANPARSDAGADVNGQKGTQGERSTWPV